MSSDFDLLNVLTELRGMLAALVGVVIIVALLRTRSARWDRDLLRFHRAPLMGTGLVVSAALAIVGINYTFFWHQESSEKIAIAVAVPSGTPDPMVSVNLSLDHDQPLLRGEVRSAAASLNAPVFVWLALISTEGTTPKPALGPPLALGRRSAAPDSIVLTDGHFVDDPEIRSDPMYQRLRSRGVDFEDVWNRQFNIISMPKVNEPASLKFIAPVNHASYVDRSLIVNATDWLSSGTPKGLTVYNFHAITMTLTGDVSVVPATGAQDAPIAGGRRVTINYNSEQPGGDFRIDWKSGDAETEREFWLFLTALCVGALAAGVVEILIRRTAEDPN